jgi:hypothetical protein
MGELPCSLVQRGTIVQLSLRGVLADPYSPRPVTFDQRAGLRERTAFDAATCRSRSTISHRSSVPAFTDSYVS